MIIKSAATPSHLETVRNLFIEYQRFLGVDLCFQNFDDELKLLPGKYCASRKGGLYLAEVNGKVAGCIAFHQMDENAAELKRLYVRDEFRGLGLGKALIERAMKDIRDFGYKNIKLDSMARLREARLMYDKLGFKECEPYNANPEPDSYWMELIL